jgi:hypothetical protein
MRTDIKILKIDFIMIRILLFNDKKITVVVKLNVRKRDYQEGIKKKRNDV